MSNTRKVKRVRKTRQYLVDPVAVIEDYDGDPVIMPDKADPDHPEEDPQRRPMLFRDAVYTVLNNWTQDEKPGDAEKSHAFKVCTLLFGTDDEVTISHEDAVFIKKRSAVIGGTLMHGRICEIVDEAELEPELDDAVPPLDDDADDDPDDDPDDDD